MTGEANDREWRLWGAAIALSAWGGLILQFVRLWIRTGSPVPAIVRMSLFFTVISNLTVAIAFGLIALGLIRFRHHLLLAGLALTMLLVGVVFELLLRPLIQHADELRVVNESVMHDLVPLLVCGAWWRLAEKGRLRARDPWLIALFPILYLVTALARGAIGGLYPYPFLDPYRIGWGGVAAYVLGISAAFLICGHLMVMLDGLLARAAPVRNGGSR